MVPHRIPCLALTSVAEYEPGEYATMPVACGRIQSDANPGWCASPQWLGKPAGVLTWEDRFRRPRGGSKPAAGDEHLFE